jgi:hypothetical protein
MIARSSRLSYAGPVQEEGEDVEADEDTHNRSMTAVHLRRIDPVGNMRRF